MSTHAPLPDGPGLPAPETALQWPSPVSSQAGVVVHLPGEKSTGSDETPVETESSGEVEFKEGGYGW